MTSVTDYISEYCDLTLGITKHIYDSSIPFQYQGSAMVLPARSHTGTVKWNVAITYVISYICAFPVIITCLWFKTCFIIINNIFLHEEWLKWPCNVKGAVYSDKPKKNNWSFEVPLSSMVRFSVFQLIVTLLFWFTLIASFPAAGSCSVKRSDKNHWALHAGHQKLACSWWTSWRIQQPKSQIFPSGVRGEQNRRVNIGLIGQPETRLQINIFFAPYLMCKEPTCLSYLLDRWQHQCCVRRLFLLLSSGQTLMDERPRASSSVLWRTLSSQN